MFSLIKIVLIVALSVVIAWFSYNAGYNASDVKNKNAVIDSVVQEKKKVETVIKYREKIKVIYRDRINKIKDANDVTNCADVKLTDMGFRVQ